MKKIILSTLCLFLSFGMNAQEEKEKKDYRHAVGVGFGTGLAIDYSFKLNESISFTARYNKFDNELKDFKQEIDGQNMLIDITPDFQSFDVCVSYHPFKNAFRLIAGYGSFQSSDLTVSAVFAETITIGDVEFEAEDIGLLTIGMIWKKSLPYAGIGFGRAVPKNKRLGFGVEFGSYFASSPEVTLATTGLIEPTGSEDQRQLLEDSFASMKYLPYIQLRLSYAIF
tara:strand:+ start:2479 stop:3156 length:678 start_codon:yes stop_codon:yes gene_type:complete